MKIINKSYQKQINIFYLLEQISLQLRLNNIAQFTDLTLTLYDVSMVKMLTDEIFKEAVEPCFGIGVSILVSNQFAQNIDVLAELTGQLRTIWHTSTSSKAKVRFYKKTVGLYYIFWKFLL